MRVRLTITGATEPTNVIIDGPIGTTVCEVLPGLSRALGEPVAALSHGARMLGGDAIIGHAPLLDGASLRRHGACADASAPPPPPTPGGVVRAAVISGPDAGREVALGPGVHVIGRSALAALRLQDPGISREHCRLEVTSDGVLVRSLPSTNPTVIETADGEQRTVTTEAALGGTDRLRLGGSVVALRTGRSRPARTTAPGDGTVLVHRVPRDLPAWTPPTLREPTPPGEFHPSRIPWLTMLLPIPVCAVMAWFWGPQMLAFALLGPLLTGGNALHERFISGKERRLAEQTHRVEVAAHESRIAEALRAERRRLEHVHPDPTDILDAAQGRTTRLWERSSASTDRLAVRLGHGPVRSSISIVSTSVTDPAEPLTLPDAPVIADLTQVGSIGICGDPQATIDAGRLIIGQLAALVVPRAMTIWTLGEDPAWSWTALLPQAHPGGSTSIEIVDRLTTLVQERTRSTTGGAARAGSLPHQPTEPAHVLVVPDAALARTVPGCAALIDAGPAAGVYTIVLDPRAGGLPAECRSTLTVTDHGADAQWRDADGSLHLLTADGVGPWWAQRLSRALAPVREANVEADAIPTHLTLADVAPITSSDVLGQWRASTGPRAVVGRTSGAPYVIDLVEDGPHALIGGTTGSGKSELLRALVAGLAAGSAPEDVSLVLIDYKGGSAFRDLATLPHVTGVVTDLDPALADRALRSLDAEIRRRERLLADAGCSDLADYQATATHRSTPLPRLVILIDELRMLVEELPDFVSGLVRLASVGRSLGIHLVLATQRPAGVITPDIAANVNLRIALRVRDRADSEAIIESPAAAAIDETVPGRALAGTGSGLVEFQSAFVSGDPERDQVLRLTLADAAFRPAAGRTDQMVAHPMSTPQQGGPIAEFVAAAGEAATRNGSHRLPAPWLEPLPGTIGVAHIEKLVSEGPTDLPQPGGIVQWGVTDRPDEQSITALQWDLASPEHLALIGSAASGRSTALISLAAGAALSPGRAQLHVHALDGQGMLADLSVLPVTGSVVPIDDRARVRRLITMLSTECQRRQRDLARLGFASIADWQESADPAAPATIVLLVDGWDTLVNPALGDFETHALGQDLIALLRNGIGAGLRCVAAGGHALSSGSTANAFGRKIALGTLELSDAAVLGLRGHQATVRPAGHGIEVRTGDSIVVAHLGATASREDQRHALAQLAGQCPTPLETPRRLTALPATLAWSDLRQAVSTDDQVAPARLLIGVDEDLRPAGFSPGLDGQHLLIAGSRGSGRSNALAALAAALGSIGRETVWIRSIRAQHTTATMPAGPGLHVLRPQDCDRLIELRRANPQLALLVDDADLLGSSPIEPILSQISASADQVNGLFACSADSSALATAYRGLGIEVAQRRTGLLLGAMSRAEADVFGARIDLGERLPGRGHLIRAGVATPIHVVRAPTGHHSPAAA